MWRKREVAMTDEPNLRATFWHLLHRAGMTWCGWAHRRLMKARDSST